LWLRLRLAACRSLPFSLPFYALLSYAVPCLAACRSLTDFAPFAPVVVQLNMYGADSEKIMQGKTLSRMRTIDPAALPTALGGHDPAALEALEDGDVVLITNLCFNANGRGGSIEGLVVDGCALFQRLSGEPCFVDPTRRVHKACVSEVTCRYNRHASIGAGQT
jgi:hypothetical protein